jgi:hypothetical protein
MAMVEVTDPLSDAHAKAVEDAVLPGGPRPSHASFRQAARRAALRIDPEGAEQRRRDAKADRYVTTRTMEDGAAELGVKLPAELTGAIYDRIDGLAKKAAGPDEPRTMDQLRADTAVDLLLGTNREHLAVEVHVTVSLPTLLGLATDPGDLEGYGPIPAELARELATNATWRRIITDPVDGTVLDVGRRRYPSAALARHVQTRDKTCRFPGCPRKARKSDLDHTRRYVDGGGTHDGQLSALCRRHHRMKDEDKEPTGWTLTQPSPATFSGPAHRTHLPRRPHPADHFPPHAPAGTRTAPAHPPAPTAPAASAARTTRQTPVTSAARPAPPVAVAGPSASTTVSERTCPAAAHGRRTTRTTTTRRFEPGTRPPTKIGLCSNGCWGSESSATGDVHPANDRGHATSQFGRR